VHIAHNELPQSIPFLSYNLHLVLGVKPEGRGMAACTIILTFSCDPSCRHQVDTDLTRPTYMREERRGDEETDKYSRRDDSEYLEN
jgi:hypothetical protein